MNKYLKILLLVVVLVETLAIGTYLVQNRRIPTEELVASDGEVCGLGEGCEVSERRSQGFNVGDQLPNLEFTDFEGNTTYLYDMLEGKDKFVLSLAVDWCSDCQRQDDKLNQYYGDLPDNYGAAVLFVDYSSKDGTKTTSYEQTKEYLKEMNYSFPQYWDEDNIIAEDFGGVLATPTNIVLDENAIIKAKTEEIDMDLLFATNDEEYNVDNIDGKEENA